VQQQPGSKSASSSGTAATKPRKNPRFQMRRRWVNGVLMTEYLPFAQDQGIINLLRQAHTKLRGSDDTFAGHRDRALVHIATAVGHLYPSLTPDYLVYNDSPGLAQPDTSHVLRDVLHDLDVAETSLRTMPDLAERHESARNAVLRAVNELNAALDAS
jgi:hypothetical protein